MAFVTKYRSTWKTSTQTSSNVQIQQDGYSGDEIILRLVPKGIKLEMKMDDYFSPIIRQKLTITFINDAEDFFDYMELFELEEKEFRVKVYITTPAEGTTVAFDGWLDSKPVEQKYLKKSFFF